MYRFVSLWNFFRTESYYRDSGYKTIHTIIDTEM